MSRAQTFRELVSNFADRDQKLAMCDHAREITYAELANRIRKLATGLDQIGIKRGDRVGIWLPNCIAYMEALLSCSYIGATVISVNTKYKSHEIADIVERSKCKALILWPEFKNLPFLEILGELTAEQFSNLQSVILYQETKSEINQPAVFSSCKTYLFDDLFKSAHDDLAEIEPSDGQVVFTTSGTTGKPKFVLHTQQSSLTHAYDVVSGFAMDLRESNLLQVNPLCGTFGLTQAVSGLIAGGTVYCLPVFDPDTAINLIAEKHITDIHGSDDMYNMLLEACGPEQTFENVKFAGFAAFNPALADIVERAELKGLKLVGLWGMSEVQAFVSHRNPDDSADERKIAGGKLISANARIRVCDPDTGNILGMGEQGELEISAPSQMKEYLDNPEATNKTISQDGYIKTGDLVVQTEEDTFTFISRLGDVLRLGGFLTDPVEIENFLCDYPNIHEAQVVSVSTVSGSKAFAFVRLNETSEGFDAQKVILYCKSHLAGYKVPVFIEVVDHFPTTESANGIKIQRAELRKNAQEIWDSKIASKG